MDRAKSIKTFLMDSFAKEGIYNVEGTDTYNACYGGTNAFFNAVNWVQSGAWNGKYAVVVCSDTAVHMDLEGIGASAVAMLVGPHAPFVLEPCRVSFMKHCWDFYRPIGWHNNDVVVDLDCATAQYEEALLWCQEQFSSKLGTRNLMSAYSFAAFHCNAPYHAKRSFRLMSNLMNDRELSREEHNALFKCHVEAGTSISAQNVNFLRLIHFLTRPYCFLMCLALTFCFAGNYIHMPLVRMSFVPDSQYRRRSTWSEGSLLFLRFRLCRKSFWYSGRWPTSPSSRCLGSDAK